MTDQTERRLWSVAVLLLALHSARMLATPRDEEQGDARFLELPPAVWTARDARGDAVLAVVARNPFRDDRRAAPRPFGSADAPTEAIPPRVRPALKVTGIAGPPWSAIVEGLPGRENGTVVRPGERVGEMLIARISKDSVRIVGTDTTWTLPLTRIQ